MKGSFWQFSKNQLPEKINNQLEHYAACSSSFCYRPPMFMSKPSFKVDQINQPLYSYARKRQEKKEKEQQSQRTAQTASASSTPSRQNKPGKCEVDSMWSAELDKSFTFSVLDFCNLPHDTKKTCSSCVTKWRTWMKNNHPAALAKFNGNSTILPCLHPRRSQEIRSHEPVVVDPAAGASAKARWVSGDP